MVDLRTTYEASRQAAARLAEQRQARRDTNEEIERLARERAQLARSSGPADRRAAERLQALDEKIADATKRRDALGENNRALSEALRAAITRFGDFADPVKETAHLDMGTPLLLMPMRLETRFIGPDLLLRAYPDQWGIDSFNDKPTDQEIENVRRFWASWFRAGGDEGMRRAAWRALVSSHGSGRGEWLIEQHKPINPDQEPVRSAGDVILVVAIEDTLTAAERGSAATYWEAVWRTTGDPAGSAHDDLVGDVGEARAALIEQSPPSTLNEYPEGVDPATAVVKVAFCIFPGVAAGDSATSSWTSAARVNVLPDRLVVLGFTGNTEVLHVVGKPIPPDLAVGPDPAAGPSDQFHVVDGDLVVPDELRWMVDFEEAIAVGMALRIPLSANLRGGFDQLIVLGLRLAATPAEEQKALETLLTHHRRSRAGLGIVKQGTPTNNTEGLPSGLDRLDDADASYDHVFRGVATITSTPVWADKHDGQWLAECLGIDASVIDGIVGAGLTDQSEARAMNTALWPATLGYFLESMMHPLFDDADIELARGYFIDHVSGRGRVPALRIGRQPYGILPATALAKIRIPPLGRVGLPPDAKMLGVLHKMLMRVMSDWAPLAQAVPHVHAGTEPYQTLLDVVALHPASVEFHQRYAESTGNLFNAFALEGFGGPFFGAWQSLGSFIAGRQLLVDLGYAGNDNPDILSKLFHSAQHRLKGPIIDDRPLSESAPVRAYCDDGRNYLQWLVDAARKSLEVLRKEEGFTGNEEPTALLYMLLRHSLLLSWWDTAMRLRLDAGIVTPAQFKSARLQPDIVHMGIEPVSQSRWLGLYDTAPAITGQPTLPLHEIIPRMLRNRNARHLAETIRAIQQLSGLPTARLERLLAEHLDCCSHRADAWIGSLVTRRLLDMRGVHASDSTTPAVKPRKGIHLGAFGYLEEVRPEGHAMEKAELTKRQEAVFARPKDAPLLHDRGNGGFVHAPSLDHGAAAAILRSGYLANAASAHPEAMAVNLTSERMRLAVGVLQGMRNGQALGALLGYQFERGLHDRHGLAEVDSFIYPLRFAFPSPGDRDGRLVIDGLALARHMQSTGIKMYPFGKPGLPPPSADQQKAIDLEAARILDVNDAVADLVLAEGVYQAVRGNFDRVGATLDAVGRIGFPTEPAILETPRNGSTLTHRMGIHLRAGLDHLSSPVLGVAVTPRSMAEPAVNEFLSSMLPLPGDVVARVRWERSDGVNGDQLVSQADLGLQPIDLVHLLRLADRAAMGELDQRIALHVERANALPPDASVTVALTEPVDGAITFFEVAPLAASLRSMVTRSRPLRPTDVVPATEAKTGSDDMSADRNRAADVLGVMDTLSADLAAKLVALQGVTGRAERVTTVDDHIVATVDLLGRVGRFAVPNSGWGDVDQRRADLYGKVRDSAREVVDRLSRRLASADDLLLRDDALPSTATDEERIRTLLLAERELTTTPTSPVPTDAAGYRALIDGLRTQFAAKLGSFEAVDAQPTLHQAIGAVDAALPLLPFDDTSFKMDEIDDSVDGLFEHLVARLAAAQEEIDRRRTAATQLLAAHDAASTGGARVEALTGAVRELLGSDALFVPEFRVSAAQGAEWAAAMSWSRTGNLTSHLATTRSFPADDWLHGVARVREKVRDFEQARLLATALGRAEPDLWPVQLPHRSEPWFGLEWPDTVTLTGARLLYTAHYPSAFDPSASHAGLLIDEWVEVVPGDSTTTGIVFNHDSPDSEPAQAMLLVVPPNPEAAWAWDDIVTAVRDTFALARLRAVEPDKVADTRYAAFLPATVCEATVRGLGISANFSRSNMLMKFIRS